MNRDARRRIISALKELNQHDFDSVLADVHAARGAKTSGAEALRQMFEAKAAHSPLAAMFGSQQEGGPQ